MWGEWAVCRIGSLERRRRGWRGLSWQRAASGGGPFTLGPPLDRSVQQCPLNWLLSAWERGPRHWLSCPHVAPCPSPERGPPATAPGLPSLSPSPTRTPRALGQLFARGDLGPMSVRRTARSPAAPAPQLELSPVSGTRRCRPASVPEVTSWAPARLEASETLSRSSEGPVGLRVRPWPRPEALPRPHRSPRRMCRGPGLQDPPRPGQL